MTDDGCIRIMTVIVDCTRECLTVIADTSLLAARLARERAVLFEVLGKPLTVISDNGLARGLWRAFSSLPWRFARRRLGFANRGNQ
jgi:transposase InsO family protein